jgi:hypothetical protein
LGTEIRYVRRCHRNPAEDLPDAKVGGFTSLNDRAGSRGNVPAFSGSGLAPGMPGAKAVVAEHPAGVTQRGTGTQIPQFFLRQVVGRPLSAGA